jgi:hypothetical protein
MSDAVNEASVAHADEEVVKERKSEPMMGAVTSATTKRHEKSRFRPKSKCRVKQPYVWTVVPFAANSS